VEYTEVVRNTVATVSREILDFVANDKKRTNVRVSSLEALKGSLRRM
jgi:hypothetical protein